MKCALADYGKESTVPGWLNIDSNCTNTTQKNNDDLDLRTVGKPALRGKKSTQAFHLVHKKCDGYVCV